VTQRDDGKVFSAGRGGASTRHDHDDLIDGGEVGDQDGSSPLVRQTCDEVDDGCAAFVVDGAGGFLEQKHDGVVSGHGRY
jgi:hypothetical protein